MTPAQNTQAYIQGFEDGERVAKVKMLQEREWVGLTDEQVRKCFFLGDAPPSSPPHWWEYRNSDYLKIYAFIEAELKEQNT